ncbi:phosphodiester glycosidase family protein [Cohnella abietis]|uniref:Phosphodiester glycosidase domain-containing protein n=1 Tax=Cohnella abietis TaxID=2507935 RepID=A0A3T1D268_9BACL|nr:phosphodiester glycosidase family protein [Cohnella abietis]BBI32210.1 hypothetical protein KCTCHS21_16090 [Cohnella abietis]
MFSIMSSSIRQTGKIILIMVVIISMLWDTSYAEDNTSDSADGASTVVCPTEVVKLPLNNKKSIASMYSFMNDRTYQVNKPKIVSVTRSGLLVPLTKGTAQLTVTKIADTAAMGSGEAAADAVPSSCTLQLQVVDAAPYKGTFKPKTEIRKVKVGSKSFSVQTISIPKGLPVDIGLAKNTVGNVEELKSMASRRNADFAINGTYFEAYGGIPEPYGTLIANGELIHVTQNGTTVGFTADGSAKMDTLRLKIEGGTDGSYDYKNNWYAVFVNRTPTAGGNSSIVFTPERGDRIGFAFGKAIVVNNGVVEKITENENVKIPRDGFVIVLTGSVKKSLEKKFEVGKKVHYRLKYFNADGKELDWSDVVTAVGAGPRVLKDGKVFIQAELEGFKQAKILSTPAARSGIGIKADGSVVLVTVGGATIKELGEILRSLGAQQGMNLDGGASSGMYANGKLLTTPGRLLSNSLLFGVGLK